MNTCNCTIKLILSKSHNLGKGLGPHVLVLRKYPLIYAQVARDHSLQGKLYVLLGLKSVLTVCKANTSTPVLCLQFCTVSPAARLFQRPLEVLVSNSGV